MVQHRKCRECANFLPIGDTVYGHCKAKPFAVKQGGWKTKKEFLTTGSRIACRTDFVEADEIPVVVRKCKRCGKEFVPTHNRQQYCCEECRKQATKEKYQLLRKTTNCVGIAKICETCGNEFKAKAANQKHCSQECAKKAKRQSIKSWRENVPNRKTPRNKT